MRDEVERLLHAWWIDAAGTGLREEDRKKVLEVSAFLELLSKVSAKYPLVDVAAGKAYLGLLAAELLGFEALHVIERNEARVEDCRRVAQRLRAEVKTRLVRGDVGELDAWPVERAVVVGLHACGPATDAIIDAAIERKARWLFLVPCCYGAQVRGWNEAHRLADAMGIPGDVAVRGRFVESVIDAQRLWRLEAGGFETEVLSFVAPTVSPQNRLFRGKFTGQPARMDKARARLMRG